METHLRQSYPLINTGAAQGTLRFSYKLLLQGEFGMYILRSVEAEDPRRRLLIRALAAGLFSAGAAPAAFAQVFGRMPAKVPPGQSIFRISGDVQVNGKPADLTTRVGPGDTIRTGKDAEVVYVVGESSFIQRSGSFVTVQAEQAETLFVTSMRIVTGALLSVFPTRRPVRITTQTATIGIRGTGLYLEADPSQTYFCLCYGLSEVSATNDKESTQTIASKHHDQPLYILGNEKAGENIRNAPFKNHTDQELQLIETLVGRTPPFVFPKDDYKAPRRTY